MTHFGEIQLPGSTLKNEQNLKNTICPRTGPFASLVCRSVVTFMQGIPNSLILIYSINFFTLTSPLRIIIIDHKDSRRPLSSPGMEDHPADPILAGSAF